MGDWADKKARELVGGCAVVGDEVFTVAQALRSVRAEALREAVQKCQECESLFADLDDMQWGARACADAIEALIAADGDGGSDG